MFWKILLAIVSVLDKIIDQFQTKESRSIEKYHDTAKDIRIRQKVRIDNQKKALDDAKAAIKISNIHDCDRDGC